MSFLRCFSVLPTSRARSPKAIISYTISSMQQMKAEITKVERDISLRKK